MTPGSLLDTHVIVRWLLDPSKLSREQQRVVEAALVRREAVFVSAISLFEIAALVESGKLKINLREIFRTLEADPLFALLAITYEIAEESALLHALRDPGDRTIVATARVHRLKLLTSDQNVIGSKLVGVVE